MRCHTLLTHLRSRKFQPRAVLVVPPGFCLWVESREFEAVAKTRHRRASSAISPSVVPSPMQVRIDRSVAVRQESAKCTRTLLQNRCGFSRDRPKIAFSIADPADCLGQQGPILQSFIDETVCARFADAQHRARIAVRGQNENADTRHLRADATSDFQRIHVRQREVEQKEIRLEPTNLGHCPSAVGFAQNDIAVQFLRAKSGQEAGEDRLILYDRNSHALSASGVDGRARLRGEDACIDRARNTAVRHIRGCLWRGYTRRAVAPFWGPYRCTPPSTKYR